MWGALSVLITAHFFGFKMTFVWIIPFNLWSVFFHHTPSYKYIPWSHGCFQCLQSEGHSDGLSSLPSPSVCFSLLFSPSYSLFWLSASSPLLCFFLLSCHASLSALLPLGEFSCQLLSCLFSAIHILITVNTTANITVCLHWISFSLFIFCIPG